MGDGGGDVKPITLQSVVFWAIVPYPFRYAETTETHLYGYGLLSIGNNSILKTKTNRM